MRVSRGSGRPLISCFGFGVSSGTFRWRCPRNLIATSSAVPTNSASRSSGSVRHIAFMCSMGAATEAVGIPGCFALRRCAAACAGGCERRRCEAACGGGCERRRCEAAGAGLRRPPYQISAHLPQCAWDDQVGRIWREQPTRLRQIRYIPPKPATAALATNQVGATLLTRLVRISADCVGVGDPNGVS
jgi:hypothetical protein